MSLENGDLLKQRYRILDILGQGGMGAVYRAIDENLDMIVAVKENSFQTEEYARQFQREAKILASLRHPNLPRVFDYFVIDQQGQYLVMDFIEGDDLRQWMAREDEISEIETLQIGIAICDALIYLHSQEPAIVHRDIKPGNVKITPRGEVILVDFGLVKIMDEKEMTTTAARAMTPGYSPPEQYGSAPTDHRSDIFSLGATLYAALAGYLPEESLARTTGKATLTALQDYNPEVSSRTANTIEKALELHFEDRWQSASAFKDSLIRALENFPLEIQISSRLAVSRQQRPPAARKKPLKSAFLNHWMEIWESLKSKLSKPDPIWIAFGAMIFILVGLLLTFLLKPESLNNFLGLASAGTETETSDSYYELTQTPSDSLFEGTQDPSLSDGTPLAEGSQDQSLTPAPTPTGGGSGILAYVSESTGSPQIWLLDVLSGAKTQLTDMTDGACQPSWSPDGSQLVFTSPCETKRSRYPGSRLYVINVKTGELTPLPASLEGNFDPAWSPDADWIAYTSLINGKMQLMKIDLSDLSSLLLSDGNFDDAGPAWSSDGKQLAFVRVRSVGQIWIMDADGDNAVQFTLSGAIDNSAPEWYPNKNLILFSQVLGLGSPSKQLYGMRLEDIGEAEAYTILPSADSEYIPLMDNVDISPDGYWLAFDYWYFDVLSDIYMMTFPGANLIQLTDHPAMDYDPVWKPPAQ